MKLIMFTKMDYNKKVINHSNPYTPPIQIIDQKILKKIKKI